MTSASAAAAALLGVPQGAGTQEIHSAFRKLALLLHPDKSKSDDAKTQFQLALAARNLLLQTDEVDVFSARSAGASPWSKEDEEELAARKAAAAKEAAEARVSADMLLRRSKVWGTWRRRGTTSTCATLRPERSACVCGHGLKQHSFRKSDDLSNGHLSCEAMGCPCTVFQLLPALARDCRCGHPVVEHCFGRSRMSCSSTCGCTRIDPVWTCQCGSAWSEHECNFPAAFAHETASSGSRPSSARQREASETRSGPAPAAGGIWGMRNAEVRARINKIHARLDLQEKLDLGSRRPAPDSAWDDVAASLAEADAKLADHARSARGMRSARAPSASRPPMPTAQAPQRAAAPTAASDGAGQKPPAAMTPRRRSSSLRAGAAQQVRQQMPMSAR
eukprot:TRINITY_DN40061_c0_g1_i1.p1 TRINITY_DN40061_c0_g1~~TRINITY_DN40061_c0_g1_i1.p1  ORF type:complete len:391 (-),score=40.23 TRINITY_DN40061_c0_g1_i1:10-1182(-)